MNRISHSGRLFIILGDIILLYAALFIALWIRYPRGLSAEVLNAHLLSFSILFLVWLIVFLISGLYEKYIRVIKNRLPSRILRVQVVNSVIAVLFFYFFTNFGIAPKTTLFLYLAISFAFIVLWRIYGPLIFLNRADKALVIGSGDEFRELVSELRQHAGYPLEAAAVIDVSEDRSIADALGRSLTEHPDIKTIVADLQDPRLHSALPQVYELIQKEYAYLSLHSVYEDVFQRLPVSLLDDRWLIENISLLPTKAYDILKRTTDLILGSIVLIASMPFCILAFVLIKIDDAGPAYFIHKRVGKNGKPIHVIKFRSMPVHQEQSGIAKEKRLTRVGSFLRKSRIDELPQLWNVIKGDLSLIGPRPEIPALVSVYEKEIPYYGLRHIVKPGLSGWAQIYQKQPPKYVAEVELTKQKVSYDLFYIKHRSFMLDTLIALKTIRELLSRRGI